ncbi:MAG: eL32 family ribosomal protein [Nanoarchaeota archaeon]
MTKQELLKQRKEKRQDFVVKESHYAPKIKSRWRYPYGRHSKVRQMHCGRPAMPTPGFGAPAEVRGLHASGLEMVVVCNAEDLNGVDPKKQGAIISSRVGARKRLSLLESAHSKGVTVLNVKDAQKAAEKINSEFQERKEHRKKRFTEAAKKEIEKKKKAEEHAKKEEEKKSKEKSSEEIKEAEHEHQKEIEKTITKRQ